MLAFMKNTASMTSIDTSPQPAALAFSSNELKQREQRLKAYLQEQDLDGLLVFSPENIYYLTGLNHFGFFSPHILIVPKQGPMQLVIRAMEQAACEAQVKNAIFQGHADNQPPGQKASAVIQSMDLGRSRLGLEKHSLFAPLQFC